MPGSAAIAAIAGSIVAIQFAIWANPSQFVGGPTSGLGPGLDTRFVAVYYAVPISAFGASVVAYTGSIWHHPRIAAVAGVLVGLGLAGIIGAKVVPIATWWLANMTGFPASWVANGFVTLLPMGIATVALSVKIPIAWVPVSSRGRLAAFLSVGAATGAVLGMLVVGEAAFVTALQSSCTYAFSGCTNGGAMNLVAGSSLAGSWLGALLGLIVGAVVAAVPPRASTAVGPPEASVP